MKPPLITLTTDFGTKDYYVGAMKGVILSHAPRATIVDISHNISPHNINEGAFILSHACREFPKGTIHCAVVDPGVGTYRQPIAFSSNGFYWIGPDNGLLSFALKSNTGVINIIDNKEYTNRSISNTFHGRDIFGPAAAALANGKSPMQLGGVLKTPVLIDTICPKLNEQAIHGQIIHIDSFGNLVSNITKENLKLLGPEIKIELNNQYIFDKLSETYGDVKDGAGVALIGSADTLEISLRGNNASNYWELYCGTPISVYSRDYT